MEKLSKEEMRFKIKAIKKIYSNFLSEIDKLKKEQKEIVFKYLKKEEKKKIKDIKEGLNQ